MRHDDDKELHTSSSNPNLTSGLLALNTLLGGSERLLSLRLLEVGQTFIELPTFSYFLGIQIFWPNNFSILVFVLVGLQEEMMERIPRDDIPDAFQLICEQTPKFYIIDCLPDLSQLGQLLLCLIVQGCRS